MENVNFLSFAQVLDIASRASAIPPGPSTHMLIEREVKCVEPLNGWDVAYRKKIDILDIDIHLPCPEEGLCSLELGWQDTSSD
jgi:hypothetical protein